MKYRVLQPVSKLVPDSEGWCWWRENPKSPWVPLHILDATPEGWPVSVEWAGSSRPVASFHGEWGGEATTPTQALRSVSILDDDIAREAAIAFSSVLHKNPKIVREAFEEGAKWMRKRLLG